MSDLIPYTFDRERKTFLHGRFEGKYWADKDFYDTSNPFEENFRINIYEAEVDIEEARREELGEFDGYEDEMEFTARFPDPVLCRYVNSEGETKVYHLSIKGVKLTEVHPSISKTVQDGNERYGTLTGKIYGYIVDSVEETVYIEKEEPIPVPFIPKRDLPTGEIEVNGIYERLQFHDGTGGTYYGKWTKRTRVDVDSEGGSFMGGCLSGIGWLIQWGLGLAYGIFLLGVLFSAFGSGLFVFLAILAGIYFLFRYFGEILGFLFRIVGTGLSVIWIGFMFFGFLSFILDLNNSDKTTASVEDKSEITRTKQITLPDDVTPMDTLIVHHRKWRSFNDSIYEGDMKIWKSDLTRSNRHHASFYGSASTLRDFGFIYSDFADHDGSLMSMVSAMFDSIRKAQNLNRLEFADLVVSCVQDIPYSLVLDQSCDPTLYSDRVIRDHLNRGGDCIGPVRFGLQSPIEFLGDLKGDCDTRTLFIYTLLDHFGYDCAILCSSAYRHSVLGVNLPVSGLYKPFQGKRYYLWETTSTSFPIGYLPKDFSNTKYWEFAIINN